MTTGASDDLRKVTDIARAMVYEYGMGTTIRAHQLPGDDFTMSESLRQTRDEEVAAIAEEAYRGAHRLLSDHRDLLDEIAERLLANEVIEHERSARSWTAHRRRGRARSASRVGATAGPGRGPGRPAETFASEPPPTTLRSATFAGRSRELGHRRVPAERHRLQAAEEDREHRRVEPSSSSGSTSWSSRKPSAMKSVIAAMSSIGSGGSAGKSADQRS